MSSYPCANYGKILATAFGALWLFSIATDTLAITVGPGSGVVLANPPATSFAATSSLEVHRISTPLTAGSYAIDAFSFQNATVSATPSTPGTVTPFLAVLIGTDVNSVDSTRGYQTIWVGPTLSVSNVNDVDKLDDPINLIATPYANGTQHFTLPADASVYAGVFTTGSGRVAFRPALPSNATARVDHDVTFTAPTAPGQTVGDFSKVFYNGLYGFQIDVSAATALPPLPGDFDGDRDVDGADLAVWQANFSAASGKTPATGDADADGDVDGADFVVWQTHFPTSSAATPVPEPAAIWLAAFVAVCPLICCRRPRSAFPG